MHRNGKHRTSGLFWAFGMVSLLVFTPLVSSAQPQTPTGYDRYLLTTEEIGDTLGNIINKSLTNTSTLYQSAWQELKLITKNPLPTPNLASLSGTLDSIGTSISNFWKNLFPNTQPTPIPTSTQGGVGTPTSPSVGAQPTIVTPPKPPVTTTTPTPIPKPTTVTPATNITGIEIPPPQPIVTNIVLPTTSSTDVNTKIEQLRNELLAKIGSLSSRDDAHYQGNFQAIALTNKIDQLTNTVITTPTITGASITGGSISGATISGSITGSSGTFTGNLTVSGTATSTFSGDSAFDTDTLYVDSLNNRVGVGTSSPSDTFALNGAAYFAQISAPGVTTNRLYNQGGLLYFNGTAVGSGSGTSSWATTTSQVSGQLVNYSLNTTDIVAIGNNSTTTAPFWFNPNNTTAYFSGNVGIGTTSPYAKLSVVGETVSSYFTATSTTATSTFGGRVVITGTNLEDLTANGELLLLNADNQINVTGSAFGHFRLRSETETVRAVLDAGTKSGCTSGPACLATLTFAQSGVLRWGIRKLGGTESGGNVGSNFQIESFDDSGNHLGYPLTFERSTGNVLIGGVANTDLPYARLNVRGSGSSTGQLLEISNNASTTLMRLLDDGTGYFLGNVGIGTTSPYAKLSVVGETVSSYFTATSTTATSTFTNVNVTGQLNPSGTKANSVVIGAGASDASASATGRNVIVGVGASVGNSKANNIVIGYGANTSATQSIVIGDSSSGGFSDRSIVIGASNTTSGINTLIGSYLSGRASNDTVFGNAQGTSNTPRLILQGSGSTVSNSARDLFSVATSWIDAADSTAKARTIFNVNDTSAREFLRADATGSGATVQFLGGNIGIGTTSPYAKLSVVGEVVASHFTATSTTATSTFAGGLNVGTTTAANYIFAAQGAGLFFSDSAVVAPLTVKNSSAVAGYAQRWLRYDDTDDTYIAPTGALRVLGAGSQGLLTIGNVSSSNVAITDAVDRFVVVKENGTAGQNTRAVAVTANWTGSISNSSAINGINAFSVATAAATGDLTSISNGGGLRHRYVIANNAAITVSEASALSVQLQTGTSGGTVSSFAGLNIEAGTGTGTVGNYYGVRVRDTIVSSLTNLYGLYTADLTGGTNNWAIYTDGTTKSYFGGNVGIGTTTINSRLTVADSSASVTTGGGTISSLGGSMESSGNQAFGAGAYINPASTDTTVVGYNAKSTGGTGFLRQVVIGAHASSTANNNTVIGGYAFASAGQSIVVGSGSKSTAQYGIVIGYGMTASAQYSTAFGASTNSSNTGAYAFGWGVGTENDNEFAFGGRHSAGITPSYRLMGSTDQFVGRSMYRTSTAWIDQTDSTRKARAIFSVYDTSEREFMRADSNGTAFPVVSFTGNVGIGTTSPYAKLSVVGETVSSYFTATSTTATTTFNGGFAAGSSGTAFTVLQNGNIGLGTASPTNKLHLTSSSASPVYFETTASGETDILTLNNTNGGGNAAGIAFQVTGVSRASIFSYDTGLNIETNQSLPISFNINGISNPKMYIATTGNVGIGTTTPTAGLHVGSAASGKNVRIANGWLCVDDNDTCTGATTAGTVYAVGAYTTGADLAENYQAFEEGLTPGHIVSITDTQTISTTTVDSFGVKKAVQGETVIGIVSTKPGLLLANSSQENIPVALQGRVPLKVNGEGGAINVGDRITLSSVPGVGQKATSSSYMVAIALEHFSGTTQGDTGTITAFVNLSYARLDPAITDGTILDGNGESSFWSVEEGSGRIKFISAGLDLNDQDIVSVRSIVGSAGKWSIDANGKLVVEDLEVRGNVKIGSPDKRTGVTLYDEETGAPYCLTISGGTTKTTSGECGQPTPTPAPAPVEPEPQPQVEETPPPTPEEEIQPIQEESVAQEDVPPSEPLEQVTEEDTQEEPATDITDTTIEESTATSSPPTSN